MEISKPYKGKGKRKLKKMPFTVKGYIYYYLLRVRLFYSLLFPSRNKKRFNLPYFKDD